MFGKNEFTEGREPRANGGAHEEHHAPEPTLKGGRVQHSILSADTTLTGDLVSTGDLTIEGTVDGSIKCRCLTLSGQPTISGSAEAEAVHLCGTFNGELRASKVVLTKTAKMRGDIFQESLEIHPGADFEGKVAPLRPAKAKPAETKKPQAANGQDRSTEPEPAAQ